MRSEILPGGRSTVSQVYRYVRQPTAFVSGSKWCESVSERSWQIANALPEERSACLKRMVRDWKRLMRELIINYEDKALKVKLDGN